MSSATSPLLPCLNGVCTDQNVMRVTLVSQCTAVLSQRIRIVQAGIEDACHKIRQLKLKTVFIIHKVCCKYSKTVHV
jgi:hypothetical protein